MAGRKLEPCQQASSTANPFGPILSSRFLKNQAQTCVGMQRNQTHRDIIPVFPHAQTLETQFDSNGQIQVMANAQDSLLDYIFNRIKIAYFLAKHVGS